MASLQWFLFVYVLGGLTFLPLVVILVLAHAYYTLPSPHNGSAKAPLDDDPAQLVRAEDDKAAFKTATDSLAEQFHRRHDTDVAAGYFAVCREYVPGVVLTKPPDKITPAGDVVAQESPSVYQSMYRSIFDRSQKPTIEPNKDNAGKGTKKTNNVFYVVLRHGHLMLYDDIQQLEVRYVISLDYHDVDIYAGGEDIPEGELWIKRNAIRLRRKQTQVGDTATSMPFFLFGQSLSEKEDFYHAILKNQEKGISDEPPVPQLFDVGHAVLLVQKLHSSEEHLQTRWLNAIIGRVFLALYKTPEIEGFLREKLTKKISRVKKPTFITKLGLRKIDLGTSAPFFTNPRLKDLTVNGDCTIEADVNYTGGLRIEIAATARIDLGARFKAREVDMVLAVTCKKLQGHGLVRCKPPPSNRLWFTFEKMPQLDLDIEPIVSSRQITYTFILRTIESRIREVVAESIVHPFWDDIPFFDTMPQKYRGGIWKREAQDTTTEIPNEEPEDLSEADSSGTPTSAVLSKDERVLSMPALSDNGGIGTAKAAKKSLASLNEIWGKKKSEPVDRPDSATPRLLRSTSFANAADPTITTNHADANTPTRGSEAGAHRESVATILKDISARSSSSNQSGPDSPAGSPPVESAMAMAMKGRSSSTTSGASDDREQAGRLSRRSSSLPQTPTNASRASLAPSETNETKDESRPPTVEAEREPPKKFSFGAKSLTSGDRKQALASVNAAAAAAQKWGWGVLARNRQREAQAAAAKAAEEASNGASSPREPMGRGRPLPPPGMPLPPPERPKSSSFLASKRKPVPPPMLPKRPETDGSTPAKSSPKPPLPERRKRQSSMQPADEAENEVLVVEAPIESAPASPTDDERYDGGHRDDFFGHGEEQLDPAPPVLPTPDASLGQDEPAEKLVNLPTPPRDEVAEEHMHTQPLSAERPSTGTSNSTSEYSPPLVQEGESGEINRQEIRMYT
ncbi:hypothetical protein G647_10288 [Cladophialophora carrionii CBS 160.54]|uniref:SMP-LTD domain-containing protein n=1 Tax=Cladophialophora carrionii CBS 160.54 TaxID=1279043 RepID=V9DLL9_9EURO|nr:uncharacterized protein G647_10288 [Cladophialophora carrionii CBS 160.54]ETI26842.1 hypothetical protein G647_10288 [Cladophialophora carrionii CBS 160.54]